MSPFLFFHDAATTEIYTLSLHDALPISLPARGIPFPGSNRNCASPGRRAHSARRCRKRPERFARRRTRRRSEEHTSELQSHVNLVCRLLLEKKKNITQLSPCPQRNNC